MMPTNANCLGAKLQTLIAVLTISFPLGEAVGSDGGNQNPPSLPEEVRQVLLQNAAALSPIKISWETRYRTDMPIDEAVKLAKFVEASSFFEPRLIDFSRQDGKYSYFRKTWRTYKPGKREDVRFFNKYDGKNLYLSTGYDEDPNLIPTVMVFSPDKLAKDKMFLFEAEYFDRAGFVIHNVSVGVPEKDESLILRLLGGGDRLEKVENATINGIACLMLDVVGKSRNRFYLDPASAYALRQHEERTADGKLRRLTVNGPFLEYKESRVWLPRMSQTTWYTWDTMSNQILEKPLVYEEIQVKSLDKSPMPDDTFVMDMKRPGMVVADSRLSGAEKQRGGFVHYQVPAKMEHLDGVIDAAIKGKEFTPPIATNTTTLTFVAANVLVLMIVIAWFAYSRRKNISADGRSDDSR